jgi:predicted nucleic acid-binding protein
MDGVVVDGSVAVAWCFPDEKGDYPQAVLDSLATAGAVVPSLWSLEVANALLMGERRKRSTPDETAKSVQFLESLPIAVDDVTASQAFGHTLHLARAHNLSTYDASYLELAMRRGLPLATLDAKLKAAAVTVGVSLFRVPGTPYSIIHEVDAVGSGESKDPGVEYGVPGTPDRTGGAGWSETNREGRRRPSG